MNELLPRIKRLVADECANHQRSGPSSIKNYCWMREKSNAGVCVFFSTLEKPQCGYFEKAVMPLDSDLKEDFYGNENRDVVVGEKAGEGLGSIGFVSPKTSVERMSLSEDRRKDFLSGTGIDDLDSGKLQKNLRRRTAGVGKA